MACDWRRHRIVHFGRGYARLVNSDTRENAIARLAVYEKFWADWLAKPETPAFLEKWNELIESGGSREIWELAE